MEFVAAVRLASRYFLPLILVIFVAAPAPVSSQASLPPDEVTDELPGLDLGGDDADPYDDLDAPEVRMQGSGWGHSVGMSQYGAQAQAKDGRTFDQILRFYYQGVDVGTTGSAPGSQIAVDMFRGVVDDASQVELRAASVDGGEAANPVVADLGNGEGVRIPHGQTATVTHDGDYVLTLNDEQTRGPGPVRVLYAADEGAARPALLDLPQRDGAGQLRWGHLEIAATEGQLRPVAHVPMEKYVRGVREVPASFEVEALKAQAVAARTYATSRLGSGVDTTPSTQVYDGYRYEAQEPDWVRAVTETANVVVTKNGSLAPTFYSSSHGGATENSEDSWAYSQAFSHLRSVDDPWSLDEENPHRSWLAEVGHDAFAEAVGGDLARVAQVSVAERTDGGSPAEIVVRGWDADGQRAAVRFSGSDGRVAGGAIRMAFPTDDEGVPLVRSQQISAVGFAPFTDDLGTTHEYNTALASQAGITRGCSADNAALFCPNDDITRGQMAAFLAATFDLDTDQGGDDEFDDIADNHHRAAINAVAREGITAGCDDTSFCPNDTVTRAQMASFLARGFDLDEDDGEDRFDDIADNHHRAAINAVAAAGISGGCDDTSFCPGGAVSRGQMTSFVMRGLGPGW
jgi:SpoIID/LytB domain protein